MPLVVVFSRACLTPAFVRALVSLRVGDGGDTGDVAAGAIVMGIARGTESGNEGEVDSLCAKEQGTTLQTLDVTHI